MCMQRSKVNIVVSSLLPNFKFLNGISLLFYYILLVYFVCARVEKCVDRRVEVRRHVGSRSHFCLSEPSRV